MTGSSIEIAFKYVLLCVTFLALATLQFAVVVSIFKLAISKFALMAGNIVGTAVGSVTAFVKLATGALVTIGVIFASLLLYNLYAGILIVVFFTRFAFSSIMAVSKKIGAMVDEIVQKISMALQQN